MTKKYALVCCFFGKWPAWIHWFCQSAAANPQADILLFSDCGPIPGGEAYPNVKVIPYTFEQLRQASFAALGYEANITQVRQVCNLKPLYGTIFRDILAPYPFWGQIDIDLIFGNIERFITDEDLANFDVLSTNHSIASGHFCLYRNEERINRLYSEISYLKEYLDGPGFSLGEYVMGGHIYSHAHLKNIRFRFRELNYDDWNFALRGAKTMLVLVDQTQNRVTASLLGQEVIYVHFQESKKRKGYFDSLPPQPVPLYLVTERGFVPLRSKNSWAYWREWLRCLRTDAVWLAKFHFKKALGIAPFRYE